MKTLFSWLGVLVSSIWLLTVLLALTLIWDTEWINADSSLLNEGTTEAFHLGAVYIGICLGPTMLFSTIRNMLDSLEKYSYMLSFVLSMYSVSHML